MLHARHSWLRYLWVWLALVGLTVLSWMLSLAHLGATDIAVALVIAVAKASLVGLFFMHLSEERVSVVLVPGVGVGLVLLLLCLTAADVATRHTFPKAPAPNVD